MGVACCSQVVGLNMAWGGFANFVARGRLQENQSSHRDLFPVQHAAQVAEVPTKRSRQREQRRKGVNPRTAVGLTQRRKGAKTQGFRLPGACTRQVSKFKPVFPSLSPCRLRLCLLASLR